VRVPRIANTVRRLGHRPWFALVGRAYVPFDRLLGRLTGGRLVLFGLRDLPSLLITTTGRKSGEPRSNPLLYVRDGDAYVVIGSNWGQTHQPAWVLNLLAQPDAAITVGGAEIPVRATLAEGAARERLFAMLLVIWPAYDTYVARAGGRDIRVFSLLPR
jgi:deazaflavin-dependent oxidoreductase (nitroreductase family)